VTVAAIAQLLTAAVAATGAATAGAVQHGRVHAHAAAKDCRPAAPVREHLITTRRWLHGVAITEYYSTPERFFRGIFVRVPGLQGRHRVDWLYSSRGVSMEGDGIGLDRRHYHIDALGSGGWVNAAGHPTRPGRCAGQWSAGRPVWLQGGWRNARGQVTFPLSAGGWSNGPARGSARSYLGVTFAPGSSIPLHAYRTAAVDPRLIPRGSRLYIPAYKSINGGWFVAQDTGGAIISHHVDIYRPPPTTIADGGRYLKGKTVLVIPPGR